MSISLSPYPPSILLDMLAGIRRFWLTSAVWIEFAQKGKKVGLNAAKGTLGRREECSDNEY